MEGARVEIMRRLPGQLPLALGLLALTFAGVRADLQTPDPAPANTPSSAFSADRAIDQLARALGDQRPHPMGSRAGKDVAQRIAALLIANLAPRSVGATMIQGPELHSVSACGRRSASCGRVHNVVLRFPGTDPTAGAVLLSAHHDSVASGPGAGDDGSGVAVLLELARNLAEELRSGQGQGQGQGQGLRRPLVMLFVDGEEHGLLGAEAFLRTHPWAQDIDLAINLDSGGNDGLATITRTSAGNGPVIAALAGSLQHPRAASITQTAYALTPYDTDFSAYDRAGIFGLDIGIGEDKAVYHTPNDRLEALDRGSVQHLGETAREALRALDDLPREALTEGGERVYLDLAGRSLWTCPAPWIPWICAALLALLLTLLRRLSRAVGAPSPLRRASTTTDQQAKQTMGRISRGNAEDVGLSIREGLRGALAWALSLVGAIAAGAALAWILAAIAGAEMASYAAPQTTRIALWSAVLATSAAIAIRVGRNAAPVALWAGAWASLAVLTLILSLVDPGATVAILPAVAAQVLLAGAGLLIARDRLPIAVLLLGLLAPGFLWLQAALRVELLFGLGRQGAAIALAPIALLAALLGPLWVAAPRRAQRLGIAVVAAIALLAAIVSAIASPQSVERARRMSIIFHRHAGDAGDTDLADEAKSRWLIGDRPGGIPEGLRSAADFADRTSPSFPWSGEDDESWIASADDVDLEPPQLDVLGEEEPGPWGRLVHLRLRSPRGARRAALLFPERAEVRAIMIDDVTLAPYPDRKLERYPEARHYGIIGVPADGVEITVMLAAQGPLELMIWDIVDGLPATDESRAMLNARPDDHVPTHGGDLSLVSRRVLLDGLDGPDGRIDADD